MSLDATRATKNDRKFTLGRLNMARRRGRLGPEEYRLRRDLAKKAVRRGELSVLLEDLSDLTPGRDHWRYGRWRGPVREGSELEVQRVIGIVVAVFFLVLVFVTIYAVISAVQGWL
ncbi:DUF1707 domain-containing protein [Natronoglycomyces albus]|uniref:DUF1707 domain-containing protein n=1 Tax=Natronoglycomyces albus TaxID=2811108 RepID=A0A895XG71_9ACTN|nr:DUF1707 domain-containing protein [Natronoglycomyces albus]QSB04334.1 DUF1707 domain-containing protein [Natronoglycomyces albus]